MAKDPHTACVDAWLRRSAPGLSAEHRLRLFEAALGALWDQAVVMLGDVTLTAIADRVLHNAAERFPLFLSLRVGPAGGVQTRELQASLRAAPDAQQVQDGIRFVLVEFLTVLGNLTAEILTPELHATLTKVELPVTQGEAKP